ncbi:MAG: Gx transporter family protein [Oscillospiraceae bacterium]|nr:Gx transporter family protein [Oscillospiraceae bacterium]
MNREASQKAAFLGISLALCIALSWLDSLLSSAMPIPGLRLGLANTVICAILMKYSVKEGFAMSLLRSGFVGLTRGAVSGIMSLCGGMAAFVVTALLISRKRLTVRTVSVLAAAAHTVGQLAAACVIMGTVRVLYYGIFLLPAALVTGFCTGTILDRLTKTNLFDK